MRGCVERRRRRDHRQSRLQTGRNLSLRAWHTRAPDKGRRQGASKGLEGPSGGARGKLFTTFAPRAGCPGVGSARDGMGCSQGQPGRSRSATGQNMVRVRRNIPAASAASGRAHGCLFFFPLPFLLGGGLVGPFRPALGPWPPGLRLSTNAVPRRGIMHERAARANRLGSGLFASRLAHC